MSTEAVREMGRDAKATIVTLPALLDMHFCLNQGSSWIAAVGGMPLAAGQTIAMLQGPRCMLHACMDAWMPGPSLQSAVSSL